MNDMIFLRYLNKKTTARVIFAVLTIAWCVTIFMLSAQPGDESSETSGGFINLFCELVVPEFSGFDGAERAEFVESLQFIVRKCAHFTAYMILAAFSFLFFRTFKKLARPLWASAAAFAFSVIYAASDEFHQSFVPGRSSQLRDVLIDSCGAAFALIICIGASFLITRRKRNRCA